MNCAMLAEFAMAGSALSETLYANATVSNLRIQVFIAFNEKLCKDESTRRAEVVKHRYHATLPSSITLYICKDDGNHYFATNRIFHDVVFPSLESAYTYGPVVDNETQIALIPSLVPDRCTHSVGELVNVFKRNNETIIKSFVMIEDSPSLFNNLTISWLNSTGLFETRASMFETEQAVETDCSEFEQALSSAQPLDAKLFVPLVLPLQCGCTGDVNATKIVEAISVVTDYVSDQGRISPLYLKHLVDRAVAGRSCGVAHAQWSDLFCAFAKRPTPEDAGKLIFYVFKESKEFASDKVVLFAYKSKKSLIVNY